MSIISCNDVAFGYEGKFAISNLNFKVNKGDYLCVLGENGAGKSTLIKGLLGLKKPMTGKLNINRSDKWGYLPQQTIVQKDFPASVFEIVLSGFNTLFTTKKDRLRATENLSKLGVLSLKNKCYRDLSGGQQQRVLLARALCSTKELLILDEPVSGLDPLATNEMYDLITALNNDGITIIMVSHDICAINYSKTILHLAKKQQFFGTKSQYHKTEIGQKFIGCNANHNHIVGGNV
ncbi:MAG: metal ABC transporter ATP-binding protein [Clostridiales bacterium]|jgi:zinc transport system ATP-binding protein|nr:metal ABC transporter ATP-binding protein [Clostridiales bacterium]